MKTRILITAATERELMPVARLTKVSSIELLTLTTGVGSVITVWSLMDYLRNNPDIDYIINIGIAGSFKPEYKIGDTVVVESDCFADLGIEEETGFTSIWEAGLSDPSAMPFIDGKLYTNPEITDLLKDKFELVSAITVNSASGQIGTINNLVEKYNPSIETMESAAVLYTGSMEKIPVIVLRSVSNFVAPRNRDAWDIDRALSALVPALDDLLLKIILI